MSGALPFGVAYAITNIATGRLYIGITTDVARRWRSHLGAARRGDPRAISRAIAKHGVENFRMDVIACASDAASLCALEVMLIEQHGAYRTKAGYNATLGGEGARGAIRDEATRAKMSIANGLRPISASHRAKISAANKGRKPSQKAMDNSLATRRRLKAERVIERDVPPRPPYVCSDQTRAKLSEAQRGKEVSADTRAKIAEALRGRTISDETRAKLRLRGHSPETRAKMSATRKGKKHSQAHADAISAALLARGRSSKGETA